MTIAEVMFWTIIALLAWTYCGYGMFLMTPLARRILPIPSGATTATRSTIMMLAVFNEETTIAEKLANSLMLDVSDLRVVVVSDGSTDDTVRIANEWAARDDRVQVVVCHKRMGKNAALNEAVRRVQPHADDVMVFTDANAFFDRQAVTHLTAALLSGAACAIGKLTFTNSVTGTARAEGLYWRYENALKEAEGAIGRAAAGNGAIFAVRGRDAHEIPLDVCNDFWVPISLLGSGRQVVYVPAARAWEPSPNSAVEEFRRKRRMANRQMTAVVKLWLSVDHATRFQLVSHKVVRWFGLPLLAVAAACAAVSSGSWPYRGFLFVLGGIVALGIFSLCVRPTRLRIPLGNTVAHFLMVHVAAWLGVIDTLRGTRQTKWEKASSSRAGVEQERVPT